MMGSMMRRAMLGGNVASNIARNLRAGTGYADIVVIGDSNAGNYDQVGARGYAGGFYDALDQGLVYEYATAMGEHATASTTYPKHGAAGSTPTYQFSTHTSTAYGTTWSRNNNGTTDRISTLDSIWKPKHLKIDGVAKDFSYLESTASQAYSSVWMKLNHNGSTIRAISVRDALTVRFIFATLPHTPNSAQVRTWIFTTAGSVDVAAAQTQTMYNTGASPVITALDRTIPADATRTETQCTFGANTTGKGPLAALACSAFKVGVPGYAIQIFTNHSGSTSTQIKDALADATGCGTNHIKTYLQLLAARQVSANNGTAPARVLVWLNFGINDGTANATANYVGNATAIINQFKAAWSSLGYSDDTLGFIATVSHPTPTFNPAGANAAAAASFASDNRVKFVDISTVVANWTPYYSGMTDAHLTQNGYLTVASEVIARITA